MSKDEARRAVQAGLSGPRGRGRATRKQSVSCLVRDPAQRPRFGDAGGAVDNLATDAGGIGGVADVRYDRRWLTRLNSVVRLLRRSASVIILLLAFASALTVANVVRLAAPRRARTKLKS